MSNQNIFAIKIGGQAGQGVKSAGLILAKIATRSGYFIYNYTEYPSLIRGGHNVVQVSISQQEITSPFKKCDLLIALNQETIDLHSAELLSGSGVLFDKDGNFDTSKVNKEVKLYSIPLSKIAGEAGGNELVVNTVALGATVALLDGSVTILKGLISEEFAEKGPEVIEMNLKAAEGGFNFVQENFTRDTKDVLAPLADFVEKMIVNGNEAISLGAIAGGLQFVSIYPMTPITNILHTLASLQEKYGFIYKQPEDEIAAINMAIGASFAGARSMTATSGGGFCLMAEGLGLSAMTETPLVVVEGMRPGPATGLPTWSGQGDLQFMLHAHQGDLPRIVLAPGDGKEAFYLTRQAFDLADKYQMPVIVLVDKNICEDDKSFPLFETTVKVNQGKFSAEIIPGYKRYSESEDGVSTRTIPGSGNYFIANSYEHSEEGFTREDAKNASLQMEKRMTKQKTCESLDMPAPEVIGPAEADITIVSWGSNKGSILEALKNFPNVNFLHVTWISPFPAEKVLEILSKARCIIDIECNFGGQFADLIREKTGIEIKDRLLRFDGRPFMPEEIIEKIENTLREISGTGVNFQVPSTNFQSITNV